MIQKHKFNVNVKGVHLFIQKIAQIIQFKWPKYELHAYVRYNPLNRCDFVGMVIILKF